MATFPLCPRAPRRSSAGVRRMRCFMPGPHRAGLGTVAKHSISRHAFWPLDQACSLRSSSTRAPLPLQLPTASTDVHPTPNPSLLAAGSQRAPRPAPPFWPRPPACWRACGWRTPCLPGSTRLSASAGHARTGTACSLERSWGRPGAAPGEPGCAECCQGASAAWGWGWGWGWVWGLGAVWKVRGEGQRCNAGAG